MRSKALPLLLASCTAGEPEPSTPAPGWVYAPSLPAWQLGELEGKFGRSQPPQLAPAIGVTGEVKVPLRETIVWSVPGEPARAAVFGLEGTQPALELIDVDAGRVLWRHGSACPEPVIGATASTIVCGGAKGVRGVSLTGQPTWKVEEPLVAITGSRIVVGTEREAIAIDADDGKELARVALPLGVELSSIIASCDGELFARNGDVLQRIADVKGKQAVAWQAPLVAGAKLPVTQPIAPPRVPTRPTRLPGGRPAVPPRTVPPRTAPPRPPAGRGGPTAPTTGAPSPPPPIEPTLVIDSIDCAVDPILVATRRVAPPAIVEPPREQTLQTFARATGKPVGKIENVRGWWFARPGSARNSFARDGATGESANEVEVSASGAVTRWPRDLTAPIEGLQLPPVGDLLDARGDRRLVRATPLTAVILDRGGVRAYVPLATERAVLGNTAVVAQTIAGVPGSGVRRIAIPAKPTRTVRVPARRQGVAPAAELRDLPELAELPDDRTIVKADTGKHAVSAIAIDPREPGALYAAALEQVPVATTSSPIARVDLSQGSWLWQRSDGCGQGAPIGLALAAGIVACAARGTESTVRATTREGAAAWEWTTDQLDGIAGGGSAVLVFDADRLTVLDAATGKPRGRLKSDDGARMRAAAIAATVPTAPPDGRDATWLVTYERGRLVARLPDVSMLAVWSLDVHGVVRALAPSGDAVLVALDDGDAYRVELATRAVTPMPGLGLHWRATGELVTGETAGGPIPGIPAPTPLRFPVAAAPGRPALLSDRNPDAPNLWVPIAPPTSLGDSWQYTLYDRSGGLRARNDYALTAPVVATEVRGPIGSPLVVASGPLLREVLVLDPRQGDPIRRVMLPGPGLVFGTIVDGAPVAGTVLAGPLRVVLF